MTFELTCTINHKTYDVPIVHRFQYSGQSLDQVIDQINTLDHHKENLRHHRKTAFKDVHGIKHQWVLKKVDDER